MRRQIIMHECEVRTLPNGQSEIVIRAATGPVQEIHEIGVDEALAAARCLLAAQKRSVRSVNMRMDGNIQVIVWKNGPPVAPVDAGWIWKRPKAQPASP
jgi:hypothetical protein